MRNLMVEIANGQLNLGQVGNKMHTITLGMKNLKTRRVW